MCRQRGRFCPRPGRRPQLLERQAAGDRINTLPPAGFLAVLNLCPYCGPAAVVQNLPIQDKATWCPIPTPMTAGRVPRTNLGCAAIVSGPAGPGTDALSFL
ncbi:MAG: hypothetical protein L0332_12095 [Chloroflexi bacterium]|nr:hypothetical protein [Chloroflexota bacterium]